MERLASRVGIRTKVFPRGESSAVESSWPSCPGISFPGAAFREPACLRLEFCRGRILSSKLGKRPFLLPGTSREARGRRALRPQARSDPVGHSMRRQCRNRPWRLSPKTPPPSRSAGREPAGRGGARKAARRRWRRRRRAARRARGLAVGGYTRGPWRPGPAVGGEPWRTRLPGVGSLREVWGPMADAGGNREKWPLDAACTRAGFYSLLWGSGGTPSLLLGLNGRCCPEGGLLPVFARYSDYITIDYMGRGAVHLLQTDARVCNACYSWGGRHHFRPSSVTFQFLSNGTLKKKRKEKGSLIIRIDFRPTFGAQGWRRRVKTVF